MSAKRRYLGEILVGMGCVTEQDIFAALEEQKEANKKLGEMLVEGGFCTRDDVNRALAEQHGMDVVDVAALDIPREVIEKLPAELARKHNIVPTGMTEGVLTVAASEPLDLRSLDELRSALDCPVEIVLSGKESIRNALSKYFGAPGA